MEIKPIAYFHSPFGEKFGIPRQAGLAPQLRGEIVLEPEYQDANAIKGIEEFEFLWLIWEFSAVPEGKTGPTVRPPRLGGNERVGVFASRSPFRPNHLGLSSVRLESLATRPDCGTVLRVLGADLMDGTPIYDIKPYLPYTDSHPSACAGFTDTVSWQPLEVDFPEELQKKFVELSATSSPKPDETIVAAISPIACDEPSYDSLRALMDVLSLDPRPHYHNDPSRIYGMTFSGLQIHFRVSGALLTVTDITM